MSEETKEQQNPEEVIEPKKGKASRIFVTLAILVPTIAVAVLAYLKDRDFFQNFLTQDEWTAQLIANLHPVLMLFPIGLFFLVVLVEILGWFSLGKWKPVTLFALFLGVFISILAAASGLVLMELEGNDGPQWTQYLWYGIGAMAAFALAFIFKIWGKDGNGRGFIYAIFLLGGAAALGYGGYMYGQNVHAYTVVPSPKEIKSPFGNHLLRKEMSAEIETLEAGAAEHELKLSAKQEEIVSLTSVKTALEGQVKTGKTKLTAEASKAKELNNKLVAAMKSEADAKQQAAKAQKALLDAQKSAKEAAKKSTQLTQELQKVKQQEGQKAQKLQQEVNALKKQLTQATQKSKAPAPKAAKETKTPEKKEAKPQPAKPKSEEKKPAKPAKVQ